MKKAGLKQKVLCSVLAASVFGVMYAGDVQAASLNGKPIKDGIVTNDTVHENGSSKFVIGQGNVSIQTNASVGIILDKIQKGESLNSILGPVRPETGDEFYTHVPITGVVGGEGRVDNGTSKFLNKTSLAFEDFKKLANINTTELSNTGDGSPIKVVIGGESSEPVVIGAIGGDLVVGANINGKTG